MNILYIYIQDVVVCLRVFLMVCQWCQGVLKKSAVMLSKGRGCRGMDVEVLKPAEHGHEVAEPVHRIHQMHACGSFQSCRCMTHTSLKLKEMEKGAHWLGGGTCARSEMSRNLSDLHDCNDSTRWFFGKYLECRVKSPKNAPELCSPFLYIPDDSTSRV